MNLAAWLATIVGPLAWRILASLGVGVVVFQGVDTAVSSGLDYARNSWSQFGGPAADLVALSGINTALAIMAGGVIARVSLMVLKRFMIK